MTDWTNPSAPTSGDSVTLAELDGALVGFEVNETKVITTKYGDKPAVSVDLTVFDGGTATETSYEDVLLFPTVVVSQLAKSVGGKVLARVGRGVAKGGNQAPWLLLDPSADDVKLAAKGAPSKANGKASAGPPPF